MGRAARFIALAALCLLALASTAQAKQIQQYFYSGESFDAGGSNPAAIAFDGVNQKVYVVGNGDKEAGLKISKFQSNGDPAGFSGLSGITSFNTGEEFNATPTVAIAVDESATASAGNLYVTSSENAGNEESKIFGYGPDGKALPGFPFSVLGGGACGLTVSPTGNLWIASQALGSYVEFTAAGQPTGQSLFVGASLLEGLGVCRIAIDSAGNFYVAKGERIFKYDATRKFLLDLGRGKQSGFSTRGTPLLAFDRADNTLFELFDSGIDPVTQIDSSGNPITTFGGPDPAHFSYGGLGNAARDLAVDPQTHRVFVIRGSEVDVFARDPSAVTVPSTSAGGVENLSGTTVTLTGTLDPDGIETTDCRFEWGISVEEAIPAFNKVAPCAEGDVFAGGSGANSITAVIGGLKKGSTYDFRLVSENANGIEGFSAGREFNAADPPELGETSVDHITSDSARIALEVNPNGESTDYHVEIGTNTSYGMSFPVPAATIARKRKVGLEGIEVVLSLQELSQEISGALDPGTLYHYRVVAENAAGITEGPDHTFRTFALPNSGPETCPNAQARQQTSAAGLLDCRAYELVSAPDTGGYDVRSDLSPDVTPLPTSPQADDAALYSMRSGTIPGVAGNPTNRGADPYLATRGANGWSTRYLGIPATNPFATGPFASPLLGFDGPLSAFAFGGPEICSPCFADGSTNIPLRLPDGSLVAGMAGSLFPAEPVEPAGTVRKPFSDDGSHFIFGTKAKLEPDANESGSDATLYDRDLQTGTTQVISKDESGATIANGEGVAALGVSEDGSRIVIGELLSTDASGNPYYHLYLHQGTSPNTIDLTPGTTTGASYAGMSADGSIVYFTTKDTFGPTIQDTDTSADLYRAEVEGGTATLTRVSTGSAGGETDECDPVANSFGAHWNAVGVTEDCSVAAVAGGGGVSADGAVYFLSPEQLESAQGTEDAPNLYRAAPGQEPQFVTTLESTLTGPDPLPTVHPFVKTFSAPSNPRSLAVDQSAGYVYVLSAGPGGGVRRYDTEGNPVNFSAGPNAGANTLTGFTFLGKESIQTAQVAVDNSGTATDGTIYVTNNNALATPVVRIFSPTGALLGQLTGSATPEAKFGGASGNLRFPTGVAVAPDGTLYVAGGASGKVYRYVPSASPVVEADYDATLNYGNASNVAGALAADADGALYAHKLDSTGSLVDGVSKFDSSQFGAPGTQSGELIDAASTAAYVDPLSARLYADRGDEVAEYLPSGALHNLFGKGEMSESYGVAVLGSADGTSSRIFASNSVAGNVSIFGSAIAPSTLVDNPLVIHAVHDSDVLRSTDFQASASGHHAVFLSTIPLTGFANHGRQEIFRYATDQGIDCVSCNPTLAKPPSDASLSPYGSNLTDDGRVFFDTQEPLVLRDANEQRDAYEWSEGTQQLISTGTSESDSALLSVSSNGKNAFFFTRQKLVPEDKNGNRIRLYTAREGGGYAFGPPTFECAASDECHGPSTEAPRPLTASTVAGTPGQFAEEPKPKCRKGKVRRRGRCVKRNQKQRQQKNRANAKRRAGR